MLRKLILAAIAAAVLPAAANAQAFQNGGFETGPNPGSYSTLNNGSTAINGWTVGGASVDYIGSYWAAMGWTEYTYNFVATGASTTLSFASLDNSPYGPALDGVSVAAVPEPAAWGMLIGGFGLAGLALRRRPSVRFARA
jgi:hypothetical protein